MIRLKICIAKSRSWAPRRARREREMEAGMGTGIGFGLEGSDGSKESFMVERIGLARIIAERSLATYAL